MKLPISRFHAFRQNERGGVAVAFAAVLVPIICSFGAAVDYSRASAARTALQVSLDAAALNAVKNASSMNETQLYDAVHKNFHSNFVLDVGPNAVVKNVVITPKYDPPTRTLTVSGSGTMNTQVMNLIGLSTVQIATLTKAAVAGDPPACVIVLDPNAAKAMDVSGNGSINVPNCGIQINSKSNTSLQVSGSAEVKAKSVKTAGGSVGSKISPLPLENQPSMSDPLINVPEPTLPGACTYMNKTFSLTETLPGNSVYCGNIDFTGNITFGAGIHYFKGATVSVGSTTNISGNEVMLYFDGASSFSSVSSGTFKITAPSTGVYAGIAVFGARTGSSQIFRFRGSKEYFVNGTIYLPNAELDLKGSADLTVSSKSGYVVAKKFAYSGDSSFTFDAHGGVVPAAFGPSRPLLTH